MYPLQANIMRKPNRAGAYARAQHATTPAPPTGAERDALIESHLPLVKFIADRLAAKLPASVERDDLVGAGMIGLLDAVDKYDPARGVLFKTYAERRVRGAILDSLRDVDWAPRSMRRRAREVEAAYRQVELQHNRPPREDEVAAALGLTLPAYQRLLGELRGLAVTGLESEDEDGPRGRQFQPAADPAQMPLSQYETGERRRRLTEAIDRLPERERQVVALYYLEELSMKEVGAVLGVTESRVSQIHTQAVIRLRAALAPKQDDGTVRVASAGGR